MSKRIYYGRTKRSKGIYVHLGKSIPTVNLDASSQDSSNELFDAARASSTDSGIIKGVRIKQKNKQVISRRSAKQLYIATKFREKQWANLYLASEEIRNIIDSDKFLLLGGRLFPKHSGLIRKESGKIYISKALINDPDTHCVILASESPFIGKKEQFLRSFYKRKRSYFDNKDNDEKYNSIKGRIEQFIAGQIGGGSGWDPPFSLVLKELMKKKDVTRGDLEERTGITERTIGNLRNKDDYTPDLETLVAICIALQLNMPEVELYFSSAKRGFKNNKKELIYKFFVMLNASPSLDGETKTYITVHECNVILKQYGFDPLTKI